MSDGLRQMWGLEGTEAPAAESRQAEQFHRDFAEAMGPVNRALQTAAAQACPADYAALDAQRGRLYDAYQATLRRIDPADASRAERDIQRVLAAVDAVHARTTSLAERAGGLSQEWRQHEAEFDELDEHVGELEAAEHPKAPTMRKLVAAIRTRSNDRDYSQALTALDQVRPKVDRVYEQHRRRGGVGDGAPDSDPQVVPEARRGEEPIEERAGYVGSAPIASSAVPSTQPAAACPTTEDVSSSVDRAEPSQESPTQDSVESGKPPVTAGKPPAAEGISEESGRPAPGADASQTADVPRSADRAEPIEPTAIGEEPPVADPIPDESGMPAPEADPSVADATPRAESEPTSATGAPSSGEQPSSEDAQEDRGEGPQREGESGDLGGGDSAGGGPAAGREPQTETRRRTFEDVYLDPVYDPNFVDNVEDRLARWVQSQTEGPSGDPVHRETPLCENNESLRAAWQAARDAARSEGEAEEGWDRFVTLIADLHYVDGVVRRVTFTADIPVTEEEEEDDGEGTPTPEQRTVTFGVGGFTYPQLTGSDSATRQRVGARFIDQLCRNAGTTPAMTPDNVPDAFYNQVHEHLGRLPEQPSELALLVETTVRLTVGARDAEWTCEITQMTSRVSTADTGDITDLPDEDDSNLDDPWYWVERVWQGACAASGALGVVGAIVDAGVMAWTLIQFHQEWKRYATTVGFWDAFRHPSMRRNPDARAFMNTTAEENRDEVVSRYNGAYGQGARAKRPAYDRLWEEIDRRLRAGNRQQIQTAEHFGDTSNLDARNEVISQMLLREYNSYDKKKQFIESALNS